MAQSDLERLPGGGGMRPSFQGQSGEGAELGLPVEELRRGRVKVTVEVGKRWAGPDFRRGERTCQSEVLWSVGSR